MDSFTDYYSALQGAMTTNQEAFGKQQEKFQEDITKTGAEMTAGFIGLKEAGQKILKPLGKMLLKKLGFSEENASKVVSGKSEDAVKAVIDEAKKRLQQRTPPEEQNIENVPQTNPEDITEPPAEAAPAEAAPAEAAPAEAAPAEAAPAEAAPAEAAPAEAAPAEAAAESTGPAEYENLDNFRNFYQENLPEGSELPSDNTLEYVRSTMQENNISLDDARNMINETADPETPIVQPETPAAQPEPEAPEVEPTGDANYEPQEFLDNVNLPSEVELQPLTEASGLEETLSAAPQAVPGTSSNVIGNFLNSMRRPLRPQEPQMPEVQEPSEMQTVSGEATAPAETTAGETAAETTGETAAATTGETAAATTGETVAATAGETAAATTGEVVGGAVAGGLETAAAGSSAIPIVGELVGPLLALGGALVSIFAHRKPKRQQPVINESYQFV